MAKFVTKTGIVLETNDKDKIECYLSKGLKEYAEEPKPKKGKKGE